MSECEAIYPFPLQRMELVNKALCLTKGMFERDASGGDESEMDRTGSLMQSTTSLPSPKGELINGVFSGFINLC